MNSATGQVTGLAFAIYILALATTHTQFTTSRGVRVHRQQHPEEVRLYFSTNKINEFKRKSDLFVVI